MALMEVGTQTYIKREISSLIINIHGILYTVDIGIKVTWESSVRQWITFRGKGSGIVQLGEGHIIRTSIPIIIVRYCLDME